MLIHMFAHTLFIITFTAASAVHRLFEKLFEARPQLYILSVGNNCTFVFVNLNPAHAVRSYIQKLGN